MKHWLIYFFSFPIVLLAQTTFPISFEFQPDYQLAEKAANYPGPRKNTPTSDLGIYGAVPHPIKLFNQEPTERIINFLDLEKVPSGPFSIEMWMINHVNQPIGASVALRSKDIEKPHNWMLGYYGNEIVFGFQESNQDSTTFIKERIDRGWKKYWFQLVATYDGDSIKLYFNGVPKTTAAVGDRASITDFQVLEMAGYFSNEPYMEITNHVKKLNLYNKALSKEEINKNLETYQTEIQKGALFSDLFHFTAGPYLHFATPNSMNISWETDRKAVESIIRYGEKLPFSEELTVEANKTNNPNSPKEEEGKFIQAVTIPNLKPSTPYFYEIEVTDEDGTTIKSGVLTFATAPNGPNPFTFGVIGDTEARPHVNFQVSKLLWDERPNFVINLGDLTDGGKQPHKFEWTHEYFTGMTPLASRIPIFPVAGNGESDLYWYKKYHKLPDPEGYYTFTYGDAQFFMLNSNKKEEFAPGGQQYVWLEKALNASKAKWKFVCHHHAPYSSDEDDYGNSWEGKSNFGDLKVRSIVPLYEQFGVDIVFFGHLHTYQRTLPILKDVVDEKNGVIYLQGGGAGGNLEDFAPNRSWFSGKTYRGHHYFTIGILNNTLQLKMYDSNGNMKDFMTIEK